MADAGWTIARLADDIESRTAGRLVATVIGDPSRAIVGVAPLSGAGPDQLGFLANSRYRDEAGATRAAAIVLSASDRQSIFPAPPAHLTLVECKAPYAWFALAAQALAPRETLVAGIAPSACVDPSARIDPSASVGPNAIVAANAVVGPRVSIGAGASVGAKVRIGSDTIINPGVFIYADCVIGDRCIIHSGAVLGADGFGFAPFGGAWIKIPQTGALRIGDDVEIGANTTVDRGAMADTVIEDGCKIDNQVQIAHNCRIGAHTVIAGCAGIAGSATIGRNCMIGGAAGISGHITIADGSVIGGATVVSRSITVAGHYSGSFPMMKHDEWQRSAAVLRQIDQMRDRIRALEKLLQKKD
jgi:UDP-3-O-[3-hydroxymyristoyl] glucosamine N-acyltransferase